MAEGSEDVRNGRRVAEGVHVVAYVRPDAETVLEVPLSVQDLAPPPGFGRQVGVGLEILAAGNVPLTALDVRSYALEEIRVQPLDLLVDPGFPAGEDELGVLIAAVHGRPERRQGLIHARLPPPQPHGVNVGVADHVHDHVCVVSFASLFDRWYRGQPRQVLYIFRSSPLRCRRRGPRRRTAGITGRLRRSAILRASMPPSAG